MPAALRSGMCCGLRDVLRAMITDVLRVMDGF